MVIEEGEETLVKYGYALHSSYGQSFKEQYKLLSEVGCERIIEENNMSERAERAQLLELMGEGDTLVVTKLDRFVRHTKEAIQLVNSLLHNGIKVHILNVGLLEASGSGWVFIQTLQAVEEMEKEMLLERTQKGKRLARNRAGYKEGRPAKYTQKELNEALLLLEETSYKKVEEVTGISKSTLVREKRKKKLLK